MTDLLRSATLKLRDCMLLAEKHYGQTFRIDQVSFDLRGGSAGQMRVLDGVYKIRINKTLLLQSPEHVIDQTVPHEVAHLVARQKWGRNIQAHGKEWKSVMTECFKLKPDRCHDLDVSVSSPRPFIYSCKCNTEHPVSAKLHGRIQAKDRHICKLCKSKLYLLREEQPVAQPEHHIPSLLVASSQNSLSRAHIESVQRVISGRQVDSVTLHLPTEDPKIVKLLVQKLGVPSGSVRIHQNPNGLPSNTSHAVLFGTSETLNITRAAKSLREKGITVRLLSEPA